MRKKKSPKQLRLEQEAARKKRKKEIGAEYAQIVKDWKEYNWDLPIPEKESWVSWKLEEWEDQQPLIVTGKYQDEEKIISTYQQKFVEYIRQLYPDVIEELREFTHYFDELLGENKDNYLKVFDWHKNEISDFSFHLESYINSLIPYFPPLEFRPNRTQNFRLDFKWGEDRLTLNLFYLLLIPAEKRTEKTEEILNDTVSLLRNDLVLRRDYPNFPKDFNEEGLEILVNDQINKIYEDVLSNRENYQFSRAREVVANYLKDISTDAEPNVEAFIALQVRLLKWAEKHNLEKDWILKYAYYFLKQFSENPQLKVSDIEVGYLAVRTLEALPFSFKFDGWFAGDESRELYEKKLKESFAFEVERYFQSAGRYLELDKIKKITKPIDFDLVKPLVRKVVQNWSLEKIVENEFEILDTISEKEKFLRKVNYLKEQFPKFDQFDLPID